MKPFTEEERNSRILAVESSCDETAAAVIINGRQIASNIVASQIELHQRYGGVFPEVASRQHVLVVQDVIQAALKKAHLSLDEIDAIAVTRGPGLPGSLVVGMNAAKGLAMARELPLIGINHLEGHIYSAWLAQDADSKKAQPPQFPALVLVVSGGHTELILMEGHLQYKRLGATLDDAAGEAFDKVARLLDLGYPGGPAIQKTSESGNPKAFNFPIAKLDEPWDFSFSGLKTAVLRVVNSYKDHNAAIPAADIAASFQQALVNALVEKTLAAAKTFDASSIILAGGVSANRLLRDTMQNRSVVKVHIPPLTLCTDNAAMIGAAGHYHYVKGDYSPLDMDVLPNWTLV